jgi:Tfp pilus assembly protein FimV
LEIESLKHARSRIRFLTSDRRILDLRAQRFPPAPRRTTEPGGAKATAPPPDPTAQAIHDLQTSLQQAVNQLRILQQTVSSDQAETNRLSGQVNALSGKLEALQQSFASAQQAPAPVVPIELKPATPKRGAR